RSFCVICGTSASSVLQSISVVPVVPVVSQNRTTIDATIKLYRSDNADDAAPNESLHAPPSRENDEAHPDPRNTAEVVRERTFHEQHRDRKSMQLTPIDQQGNQHHSHTQRSLM